MEPGPLASSGTRNQFKICNVNGVSFALQIAAPGQQKLVVISVSPQSSASLAARLQLNPTDTAKKLTAFFKKLGR